MCVRKCVMCIFKYMNKKYYCPDKKTDTTISEIGQRPAE